MKSLKKLSCFPKTKPGLFASGKTWDKSLTEFVVAIEPVKSIVNLPKHAKLLEEGQMPEGIFVLLHGCVKLFLSLKGGKMLILRVVQSGEVLGLSATMSAKPAEYTAETLSPTQFLYVPRKDFLQLLEQQPEICVSVVEVLSHQLREAVNMIHYSCGSQLAVEKLADLLAMWISECGKITDRGIELKLLLTQEEIGQIIGVSRETVSRLLAEFEELGVLELEGSRVRLRKGHSFEEVLKTKRRKAAKGENGGNPIFSTMAKSDSVPPSPPEGDSGERIPDKWEFLH